ncbi:hypothetical protein FB451DRAFT_1168138 [Mycena latifolia]|nr:hypothetical protein FB451DRAFT_1168138 [Mycena latifolia]
MSPSLLAFGQVASTETTSLIPPPPRITVEHEALGDKFSKIVRAKEGKMVSIAARAPFTMTVYPASAPIADDSSAASSTNQPGTATISRRLSVLTMTPAPSANLYSYADGNSRRSSSSRSSSRRPHSAHSQRHSSNSGSASNSTSNLNGDNRTGSASARRNGNEPRAGSEVLLESASEASEADEPPAPADAQGITFSWDD